MFGALRQGSAFFVLDKQNGPTLRIGSVVSVTQPTGYNSMPWLQNMPGQTVDALVKFDDGTQEEYKQLQANQAIAVYGNVVVAETRELMTQEVDNMARSSKNLLDTVDYHRGVLVKCEEMMRRLSPSFAKDKETDERLNTLERGLGDIKQMLAEMSGHASSVKTKNKDENGN